jgi:SAM-dependent methyltransferase
MSSIHDALQMMELRGALVEKEVRDKRPDLLNLFLTYQNESLAARRLLDEDLKLLRPGSKILEIGGGVLALAVQLANEGFQVTSVEPAGNGFEEIPFLMQLYSNQNKKLENLLVITLPVEECEFKSKFNYIFSINVMEHLDDPYEVTLSMINYLVEGAKYRFFCPNYNFPYEPHFSKWIFSRKNEAFFLKKENAKNSNLREQDIEGLYESLNFITYSKFNTKVKKANVKVKANQLAFFEIVTRALHDNSLSQRHPGLIRLVKILNRFRMLNVFKISPIHFQPIMDIEVYKS